VLLPTRQSAEMLRGGDGANRRREGGGNNGERRSNDRDCMTVLLAVCRSYMDWPAGEVTYVDPGNVRVYRSTLSSSGQQLRSP